MLQLIWLCSETYRAEAFFSETPSFVFGFTCLSVSPRCLNSAEVSLCLEVVSCTKINSDNKGIAKFKTKRIVKTEQLAGWRGDAADAEIKSVRLNQFLSHRTKSSSTKREKKELKGNMNILVKTRKYIFFLINCH